MSIVLEEGQHDIYKGVANAYTVAGMAGHGGKRQDEVTLPSKRSFCLSTQRTIQDPTRKLDHENSSREVGKVHSASREIDKSGWDRTK